mmetsp:Transcript_17786/g.24834  ORF Transcript_17786/g.24834 Transcript_17786/m.24834 type:complete len:186 (-) Transcript_17786:442-999(-)
MSKRKGRFREKNYLRIKILSMGDAQTGKSCLIKRHCEHKFVSKYIPTIGVDFGVRPVKVDDKIAKINFYDLSGNTDYAEIRNEFYKDAQGVLLVFDVTSRSTMIALEDWLKEMESYGDKSKPLAGIVCGNKVDKKKRVVEATEAESWAKQRGFLYYDTSAKSGHNVDAVFETMYQMILDQIEDAH